MMSDYSGHFVVRGQDVIQHAKDYASGLLGTERRKNMEGIHGDIPESNYQGIQQFISDSPWDHKALMEQVAGEANGILGGHRHSTLILDESSFVKKGESSVGVQRQYCGRLGKTENCQLGVFACLGRGDKAAIVDFRLFLPESWAQDAERCKKAQVPEEERKHRSKLELALDMVKSAKLRALDFQWVLADSAYGCSNEFCEELESMGLKYLMDTSASNQVWDADPNPRLPERGEQAGRPKSRHEQGNPNSRKWTVEKLIEARFDAEARQIEIRKTTQGKLRARIWVVPIWVWDEKSPIAHRRTLVAREEEDGKIKASWTNAPQGLSWEELAYVQAQRHWIERTFQDCKSQLGMAQYEVRKWKGWHHHMAMVSLAMLFVLKERISHCDSAPLLSPRDIVELLAFHLPRRGHSEDEVVQDLIRRHTQRIKASESHARAQLKIPEKA